MGKAFRRNVRARHARNAVITNCGTVGANPITFRYFTNNGDSGSRPFNIYNPNSADDARLGQTQSIYVVWEIDPNA